MKSHTHIALVAAAVAFAAGGAQAGMMTSADGRGGSSADRGSSTIISPFAEVNNTNQGVNSIIKSVEITLTGAFSGELLSIVEILSEPAPTIFRVGDGSVRPYESFELIDVGVTNAVRFTFADNNLFMQGENLRFAFTARVNGTEAEAECGIDLTFVPAPGVTGLAGFAGLMMARRRR